MATYVVWLAIIISWWKLQGY